MESIWKSSIKSYPTLKEEVEADVCVVGGGIAGFLTAFMLAEKNFKVVLLEAKKLFNSTTVNTTAFLSALQGVIYSEIKAKHGLESAKKYFNSQIKGIDIIEDLVNKYNIDCNFKRLPAYMFARGSAKDIKGEFATLLECGAKVGYLNSLESLPLKVNRAIKLGNQACFHPIKFLTALPVNFEIYENSRVNQYDFKQGFVVANNAKVSAKHIVIATHFPIFDFPELLFTKMYQSASYCQAYQNNHNLNGLYIEDLPNGLTFRNYADKIIVEGFGHRTGRICKLNPYDRLERAAREVCGASPLTHQWMAQDCITFDYMPFASKIANYENNYVITGFNKWGMANSFVCAQLVCDLVQNKANQIEELFSLNRTTAFVSPTKSAANLGVAVKSLFKSFFVLPFKSYKRLKAGQGGIFLVNGKKCGVYKDHEGNFNKVDGRCGHLKCELGFNKHTTTFDCVCHGSRYTTQGDIINEPTAKCIRLEE